MYCVQCGVHLADTEKTCPLCGTRCYHPDIPLPEAAPLYPRHVQPQTRFNPLGVMSALTILVLIPMVICLQCDWNDNHRFSWSGYAVGAIILFYEIFLLPGWFRKPNPVIFAPCGFVALALYLLYIDLYTRGGWFLGFAFPLIGGIGLICTILIALLRYLRKGRLYIIGGCAIALGIYLPVMEILAAHTFYNYTANWSVYPSTALILLGCYLIFLGICRPARESIARKFFI